MVCNVCKREIPENSAFCPYCGSDIHEYEMKKKSIEKISSNRLFGFFIIGIILMIIIVAIIVTTIKYQKAAALDDIKDKLNSTKFISNFDAYKNILNSANKRISEYSNSEMYGEYFLYDINKDDLEELIVIEEKEDKGYAAYFYTYKDNNALKIGEIADCKDMGFDGSKDGRKLILTHTCKNEEIKDSNNEEEIFLEESEICYNNSAIEIKKFNSIKMSIDEYWDYVEDNYEVIKPYDLLDFKGLEEI